MCPSTASANSCFDNSPRTVIAHKGLENLKTASDVRFAAIDDIDDEGDAEINFDA